MKTKRKRPSIVLQDGKPAAVILDIEEYQEMLERLEDFEDQNWVGIVKVEGAVAASSTYISNKRVDRFYLNTNPSDDGASAVVNIWLHGRLAI